MLGALCSNCCDKCSLPGLPQSIEIDIDMAGGGLYAGVTYRTRGYEVGRGIVDPILSVARTWYSRPVTSGTYSLALESTYSSAGTAYAVYKYTNGHFSILASSSWNGNFFRVDFGGLRVAESLIVQTDGQSPQVKTSQEMSNLFDSLISGATPTDSLFFRGSENRSFQGLSWDFYYSPYTSARYGCAGSSINKTVFTTDFGFDYVTDRTLFPFSFKRAWQFGVRAASKTYYDMIGSYWIGRSNANELGSFFGNWQIQEFPQTYSGQPYMLYSGTWDCKDTLVVSECRAVFTDGTTKKLPFA